MLPEAMISTRGMSRRARAAPATVVREGRLSGLKYDSYARPSPRLSKQLAAFFMTCGHFAAEDLQSATSGARCRRANAYGIVARPRIPEA